MNDFVAILFVHPACDCGDTIELVRDVATEYTSLKIKETSLIEASGRKEAFECGVKIVPSIYFLKENKLLVTSAEITRENLKAEFDKLI